MLSDYTSRVMNRAGVWGYWKLDEGTGTTLADASGQAHPLTLAGAPSFTTSGPSTDAKSVDFSTVAQYAYGASPAGGGSQTFECWTYLTALPSAVAGLMGTAATAAPGSQNSEGSLYLNADGTVVIYQYNGNLTFLNSPSPVALNVWNHIVGSFSPAGMKIRINKVTVASNTAGSAPYGQRPFWLHGGLNNGGGAVRIAAPSYYLAALSDAETDAGYDAMKSTPTVTTYIDLNLTDGKTLVAATGTTAPAGFRRATVSASAPTPTAVGQLWLDNDE